MRIRFLTALPLCLIPVALMSCGVTSAERTASTEMSTVISLESKNIDIRSPDSDLPASLRVRPGDLAAERFVLVKYPAPIDAEQDRVLRSVVPRVYTYLPEFTYLVQMPPGSNAVELQRATGAMWVGPYHPQYKISKAMAAISAGESATQPEARIVMVHVFPDAPLEDVAAQIRSLGVQEIAGQGQGNLFSKIRLLLTDAEIVELRESLAQIPNVFWLDIESRRVLLNDTTIWVGQSGLAGGQTTPVFANGIQGQGQIVAVLDTGIDPDMCYFRDPNLGLPPRNECNGGTTVDTNQRKVIAVDFLYQNECNGGIGNNEWDNQDHGTHVAGTVAGDNFANLLGHDPGDGMAPAAKLVIQDGGYAVNNCADLPGIGCPVVDLNPIFQQTYDQGARIHSNSWGDNENAAVQNDYSVATQDADEFSWNHKDFLIVFAAGNSGPADATVSTPSTGKSVLSVGSTQRGTSANSMSTFSSCGPTDDGRIKPEIVVPGSNIVSANSDNNTTSLNCNTRTMSGTSMATPGAAGFAALIRQYYMDGFYPSGILTAINGFTPTSALIRATMINSGARVTNATPIPGNCQGWGRVTLDDTLYFPNDVRKLWVKDETTGFAQGSTNETQVFKFNVGAAVTPFKATLAWTDYPSTPAAMPHINNDLDLEVVGPGGTYLGNVFTAGQSTTGGMADRINTVEQVVLNAPMAGEYTVTVRSFNIPNGPQPFALVVTGDLTTAGGQGAACVTATDCGSGFCVDGVCCNSPCNGGVCDACSVAAGALQDGMCRSLTGNACDDGNACTQMDACNAGVCVGASPVTCAAMDTCHDAGTCDPMTGACSNPVKPEGSLCDDGDRCTLSDRCIAGACMPVSTVTCAALDACHDAGVCDKVTGLCSNPEKPEGTACDDGNLCTLSDVCIAGTCTAGGIVDCLAPDNCHDAGKCDPATGACVNPEKPTGTPCDDGNACTVNDVCVSGVCQASVPFDCAPSDECHDSGTCDPMTGACSNPAKPDGSMCSKGICEAGICIASPSSSSSSGSSGNGGNGGMGGMNTGGIGETGGAGGGGRPPLVITDDGGCGCSIEDSPERKYAWVGLGLLFAMRRRRRSSRS